jgi:hypothetical protein
LIFFGGEFTKNILCYKFLVFLKTIPQKMKKLHKKIAIIVHTMEGCLRFDTFIFQTLPTLAKYIYGLSSLERYHKIGKKNTHTNVVQSFLFQRKILWVRVRVY